MRCTRSSVFNAFGVLCLCFFMVYLMQNIALDKMSDMNRNFLQPPMLADFEEVEYPKNLSLPGVNVWITMGLCWSSNTKYHGKVKFPYVKAAPMSSKLWMSLTPAKVILQIVYSEDEPPDDLLTYKKALEEQGVTVSLVKSGNTECVLKAQIIRILAYLFPFIGPNDIIVTADVDAFIVTPDIFLPLQLLERKIWIFRYKLSRDTGYTFMMPFIGARSSVWQNIIEYNNSTGIQGMIDSYKKKMSLSDTYTWDIDQHIVTYSILNSRLCTLPKENPLWKELNLQYREVNDNLTCWHGGFIYEDCNNRLWSRNAMIRYRGKTCKWWHFFPDETEKELKEKYEEILSGVSEKGIINILMKTAKDVQIKAFGKMLI